MRFLNCRQHSYSEKCPPAGYEGRLAKALLSSVGVVFSTHVIISLVGGRHHAQLKKPQPRVSPSTLNQTSRADFHETRIAYYTHHYCYFPILLLKPDWLLNDGGHGPSFLLFRLLRRPAGRQNVHHRDHNRTSEAAEEGEWLKKSRVFCSGENLQPVLLCSVSSRRHLPTRRTRWDTEGCSTTEKIPTSRGVGGKRTPWKELVAEFCHVTQRRKVDMASWNPLTLQLESCNLAEQWLTPPTPDFMW